MTSGQIESFLAVCRQKTMSRAAESLFVGQPSLSVRIKTLEKELGGPLFDRKPGRREMILTPAGERFYELALRYETLMGQMSQVCHEEPPRLRISALNSLGAYILPEIYDSFMKLYPDVDVELQDVGLELQDAQTTVIRSVLSGQIDVAMTVGRVDQSVLKQKTLFYEPIVLVSSRELPEPVSMEVLIPEKQVYAVWCDRFVSWYQRACGIRPQVRVSIMEQLRRYMEMGDHWAFVPESVATGLEQAGCVRRYRTAFSMPLREVCAITAPESPNSDMIFAFLECVRQTVSSWPQIIILPEE